jgi:hypothetical protein
MSVAKRMIEHSWLVDNIDTLLGEGDLDEEEDAELIAAFKTYPWDRTPAQDAIVEDKIAWVYERVDVAENGSYGPD